MDRMPTTSQHSLETSPVLYNEMPNHYSDRVPYMQPQQPMSHSQSPLSIHTNYAPQNSHFKVHMWQNRVFDSGVQTMQNSQSASVMSYPAGSEMSAMSMMEPTELTNIQQQKFDNITTEYSVAAVAELLNLMRDEDEAVVTKAMSIMTKIAKRDVELQDQEARIKSSDVINTITMVGLDQSRSNETIRAALCTMFHICSRPSGLALVIASVDQTRGDLVRFITDNIEKYCDGINKYAILTLHSILTDSSRRYKCIAYAKPCEALKKITNALQREKSEKLLSVAVDMLRILCDKKDEEQVKFINLKGIPILLNILRSFSYDNLLRGAIHLLKMLSNNHPAMLVAEDVPLVLSEQLKHPSERLILSSLECLRNLSHVCSQASNQEEILTNLLRLLGCSNSKMMLYTVQTIYNMSANNRENKALLEKKNIVDHLLFIMENTLASSYDARDNMIIEELNEAILSTLRHLCCGHPASEKVRINIFQKPQIFLDQLRTMRPVLLKQTLQLLVRLAGQDKNLNAFNLCRTMNANDSGGFIEQIVYILHVSINQISKQNSEIEGVQISELVVSCLTILESLCRDRDILNKTVHFLLSCGGLELPEPVFSPVFLIRQDIRDDCSMKKSSLRLISTLVGHPTIISLFHEKRELKASINDCLNENNREITTLAQQISRTLLLGAPIPSPHPDCPYASHDNHYSGSMYPSTRSIHHDTHDHHSTVMDHMDSRMAPPASPVVEQMNGAGEQFPEISAIEDPLMDDQTIDDPFVNVFCNQSHTSSSYSSPNVQNGGVITNSPNQNHWNNINQPNFSNNHHLPPYQRSDPYTHGQANTDPFWHGYHSTPYVSQHHPTPYNQHDYEQHRRVGPPIGHSMNAYHSSSQPPNYYQNHAHSFYKRHD